MRFVYFTHGLRSCWNHGNAHFLRGVLRDLLARGHDVRSYEPAEGWSLANLRQEPQGPAALARFTADFADLAPHVRTLSDDVDAMLDGADVVIVHEWNDPALVAAIGEKRRSGGRFLLFFHDTHHRAVTDPDAIGKLDLGCYDAVLAFGDSLAQAYRKAGWGTRVFVWHEAADTRLFHPLESDTERQGVVWIGNWGDDERSEELRCYLLQPIRALGLPLDIYGVRYPDAALRDVAAAGARYRGWLPNVLAPETFARHEMTVHVPRHAYTEQLPGIPTIRVFEALACGIPLVTAPWNDSESLFRPGTDYLVAPTPGAMRTQLGRLHRDPALRHTLARHGLETIQRRHTCAHRVDELLGIIGSLDREKAA
ncbi:MAG TPA: glycosyltransferase [Rhodopila sp.]|nr:glycosyltransferase [Rhodopila sp.]